MYMCDVFEESYFDALDASQSIFLVWHVACMEVVNDNKLCFSVTWEFSNETKSTLLQQLL
jgi:hypothetical protein